MINGEEGEVQGDGSGEALRRQTAKSCLGAVRASGFHVGVRPFSLLITVNPYPRSTGVFSTP
jgi:hypothetical protein